MEEVRPGTGREAGLDHAGGSAPTVGALGDAGAVAEACANMPGGSVHGPRPLLLRHLVPLRVQQFELKAAALLAFDLDQCALDTA